MRISNSEQLNQIKQEYFYEVHMREVGEMQSSEIIDVCVLASQSLPYASISKFIKEIYKFFNELKMDKVKVTYKGQKSDEPNFDIQINNKGKKFFINKTTIAEVTDELSKIFK